MCSGNVRTPLGKRLAGVTGGDHGVDSIASMHVRNWFDERLRSWSDSDPTSLQIQLDKMTHSEFHLIFVLDMLDLESLPSEEVPSFDLFMSVWKSEYPHVVIRELKTVDSKDKVQPPNPPFLLFFSAPVNHF